jgi:hypothetical protein
MEAVFFLCSVVGVLIVLHWCVTNDKAGNRGPTKGFFAMRDAPPQPEPKPAPRRF